MALSRRRLFAATMLAGAAFAASTASAQTTPQPPVTTPTPGIGVNSPAAQSTDAVSEVVVTGSRIRKPSIDANNPVTSIDAREIEISGITDVAQLLQRQPQVGVGNNTQTTTNSIRNQGIETISLRNLGSNRTLTLINGHRQVGGGVGSSAVDVRTISTQNLTGVDIVTGGSSALYGADAVAGVVNYRTRRDLEGVLVKGQYGDSEHGGGTNYSGAITVGHNFFGDDGNVTFTATYNQNDPIYRTQRDYALTYLSAIPNPARSTTAAGGPNVPAFIALPYVYSNVYNNSFAPVIITALGAANPAYTYTFDGSGNLTPFNRGTILKNNLGTNQTQSINCSSCFRDVLSNLATGQQNYGLESTGRLTFIKDKGFIKDAEAYYEGKFYHLLGFTQSSTGTFAGSSIAYVNNPTQATNGLPAAGAAYPVFTDNAYIPASLKALLTPAVIATLPYYQAKTGNPRVFYTTRIDNDFGDREFKQHNDTGEAVAGIRGTFANDWKFDTFLNYGETDTLAIGFDRDQVKWFQQIDAVTNPANGQIVCRSTLTNPSNGCIPINIFSTSNSDAAKAYSYVHTKEHGKVQLWNFQANVTGTLFHMPSLFSGTDLPVSFATGFEYRREASDTNPDRLNQIAEVFGNVVQRTKGSYSTREGYAELDVPVLANVPFVKRLDFDASARFQDYTTTGGDWTYGLNGGWQVVDALKLRGTYAKVVRAPNITELFAAGSVSYAGISDPCDQNNIGLGTQPANRLANCRALLSGLGIGLPFTQSPATKATITTGNPNLAPERATTYTGGLVLTPPMLRHFSLTLDYYDIKIKGAIASLGVGTIANDCVDSPALTNPYCALVTRGPDGNITLVQSQTFNVAAFKTKGVDFGFSYSFMPVEWNLPDVGSFTLNANANYLMNLLYQPISGDNTTRDQGAGELGYDAPRFQGNVRFTWDYRNFTVSWATRYIGELNRSNQDAPLDYSYERIPEMYLHDLRAEYRFHNYSVYGGINNITDNDPPYTPSTYIPTGAGALYDVLGRFYYVGFQAKF